MGKKKILIGDVAEFRANINMAFFGCDELDREETADLIRMQLCGLVPDQLVRAFVSLTDEDFSTELCRRAISDYHTTGEL